MSPSSACGRSLIAKTPAPCCGFTREHLATIVARAKARGETPFDIDEVIDHVVAPIVYHILYGDRELTLAYCRQLLDRLQSLPQPVVASQRVAAKRQVKQARA